MPTASPPCPAPSPPARRLPTSRLGGAWQMAIDSWLLDQGRPALRLYRWQRPCLSLGRHLRRLPRNWLDLAAAGQVELVRRPSGGGAVLHGGDLAYALVWPHPPGNRLQAYRQACRWLQQAFHALGQPLHFGDQPAGLGALSCFATSTAADLVHPGGAKRIGSAQHWRAGRLLQHGSIQINPDARLWRQLFHSEAPQLPSLAATEAELEAALIAAAERWLPLPPLQQEPLSAAELAAIAAGLTQVRIEPSRPGEAPAGSSSTSPEASIDRTTCGSASPRG